jgi:Holliday junction resolvase RusA-like endonuclease
MAVSMKNEIYFIVPGPVVGKQRPKFSTIGGYAKAYTPKKTKDYESKVKACYLEEVQYQPMRWSNKEPLEMIVNAYFEIPKSASKKARTEMLLHGYPCKKADADNILKAAADALNGVAYTDDSQIVCATVNKIWSESPKLEVTIRELSR